MCIRYTKHIEKDAALERRFQRVSCEASSSHTLKHGSNFATSDGIGNSMFSSRSQA